MRHRGPSLAIDDFGTGYSSLSRLRDLPFDALKMDRSFVGDIEEGDGCGAGSLVVAITTMAASLGLHVVAEGVETARQAAFLREHGCDRAQSFAFAPPMSAGQLRALLASDTPLSEPATVPLARRPDQARATG